VTKEGDYDARQGLMADRIYRAALVIIGNEILSGRTQDKNLAYLAKWLNQQGIRLHQVRVVADETDEIVEAVNAARAKYDYVFTTGGIGPTHDDITVDAISAAFAVPTVYHPKAEKILRDFYQDRISEARLRMARVPQGAELIENAVSAAPGIKMENVYILAGIPSVMQGMLASLEGKLPGGAPVVSETVSAFVAESQVADLLSQIETEFGDILVGSYPVWRGNRVGANFVVSSSQPELVKIAAQAIRDGLVERKIAVESTEI
jgi:molybdenum cofactor synthesis domain-containing protein